MSEHDRIAIGLMSGTSADGVDAACLRTDGESRIAMLGAVTLPYEPDFRRALISAGSGGVALDEVLQLEQRLTRLHAIAVEEVCQEAGSIPLADVDVIGFHGHTLRHDPKQGITFQIGNGPLLAELTGRSIVFNFRGRDVAAGGEGAPLAPLYHVAILRDLPRPQLLVNLGGVANITWIGEDETLIAGDTGPGCGLLDLWTERLTGRPFDTDGHLAAQGTIDQATVRRHLESIAYFKRRFPKSADRYEFNAIDVSHLSPEDGAATLCAITVAAIVDCVHQLPAPPVGCWVTGGGAKHPRMMQLLREQLPAVEEISQLGHNPAYLEAACFGWLAVRNHRGLPTSLPSSTGVPRPICGGVRVE